MLARSALRIFVVPLLTGLWVAPWCAGDQQVIRAGLDSPRVRVAVADFTAIGGEASEAAELSEQLRQALAAHGQIEVVLSPEVLVACASGEPDVLRLKPGAARALGDAAGIDAVVYGRVVHSVNNLLDDPINVSKPFCQFAVAETLTLEGQMRPSAAIPLGSGPQWVSDLAAQVVALLPGVGRVLAIVEAPETFDIQLFPLGGRVLASDTDYGVYDSFDFRPASVQPSPEEQALACQDMRPGVLTGRVHTAEGSDDHVVTAVSVDPAGRVAAGQLVALLPPTPTKTSHLPTVLVNSEPMDAVVFADNRLVGITPVAVDLESGRETTLIVMRRDFSPARVVVTPPEGSGLAVHVRLQEIPPVGILKVTSDPPGATITLDAADMGVTPAVLENVPAGTHELTLTLEGYKAVRLPVMVQRMRTTEVPVVLEKDLKAVVFESRPEGARVSLDGVDVGLTPVRVPHVQVGSHEVRLSLAGHALEKQTIRVRADADEQTFSFDLRPLAGNLRVETIPPGATVSVDGEERGKTPLALRAVPIGQHQVTLEMDGFLPVTVTVQVQDQETAVVQERLVRAEGSIVCESVPKGARVILDGKEMGVTPLTLEGVPVGMRILELAREGYRTWRGRVPVKHGQTTKVEVGLIRESQAGPRPGQ